jgi:molybdate transport system ATP-binding protein
VQLEGGAELTYAAPLDQGPDATRVETDDVLVAIRPASIAIHSKRPDHASPRNMWSGTVAGMELLTDRIRVQIDGAPPALVDVTPDAVAELDLVAGRQVWLTAKATDVDVYPEPGRGTQRTNVDETGPTPAL